MEHDAHGLQCQHWAVKECSGADCAAAAENAPLYMFFRGEYTKARKDRPARMFVYIRTPDKKKKFERLRILRACLVAAILLYFL